MKKQIENSGGGALVITLGILLMLTIAAVMAVHTAHTDIELTFNQLHYDQAFYVAEAGLTQAFMDLNQNNQWDSAYVSQTFEQGSYTVVVHRDIDIDDPSYDDIGDTVEVRSTGIVEQAHANLRAIVVPVLEYPFVYAMYGDSAIVMDNNTCTDSYNSDSADYVTEHDVTAGDVASNGTIDLIHTAEVGGDVISSLDSGITVDATSTVYQNVTDDVEPFVLDPIPTETFDYYSDPANNSNALIDSDLFDWADPNKLTLDLSDTLTLTSGVYYFTDLILNSNSCLLLADGAEVTIYMTGTLSLDNNTSINITQNPADLLIYSSGTVTTVGNDTEIHAAFFGPDADVTLDNSCDWYGSLITNSASLVNTGCVHYDEALAGKASRTTGEMKMIAWEEE